MPQLFTQSFVNPPFATGFFTRSTMYPKATGFAVALIPTPGGRGNGGFLRTWEKKTGCEVALLKAGAADGGDGCGKDFVGMGIMDGPLGGMASI